jgi:hypothetical protein
MRLKYITPLARDITDYKVAKVRGIVPSDRLLRHISAELVHDQLHTVKLLSHQHGSAVGRTQPSTQPGTCSRVGMTRTASYALTGKVLSTRYDALAYSSSSKRICQHWFPWCCASMVKPASTCYLLLRNLAARISHLSSRRCLTHSSAIYPGTAALQHSWKSCGVKFVSLYNLRAASKGTC